MPLMFKYDFGHVAAAAGSNKANSTGPIFIFHKVDGQSSNCCARWRIDSFGSSSTLCSTAAIVSSVRTVRRHCGCVLSHRVNVVRKRSMVNRINDYVDHKMDGACGKLRELNHYFRNKFARFASVVLLSTCS